jgi:hypothetical protein
MHIQHPEPDSQEEEKQSMMHGCFMQLETDQCPPSARSLKGAHKTHPALPGRLG